MELTIFIHNCDNGCAVWINAYAWYWINHCDGEGQDLWGLQGDIIIVNWKVHTDFIFIRLKCKYLVDGSKPWLQICDRLEEETLNKMQKNGHEWIA